MLSAESSSGDLCLFLSELDSVMLLTDSGSEGMGEQSDKLRSLKEESCLREEEEGTKLGRGSSQLLLVGSVCVRELLVAEVWEVRGVEVASGGVDTLTAKSGLFCRSVSEVITSEDVAGTGRGGAIGGGGGGGGVSEWEEKDGKELYKSAELEESLSGELQRKLRLGISISRGTTGSTSTFVRYCFLRRTGLVL